MDQGNWVPIDKNLVQFLPKKAERPFSELEAVYSLAVDYDNNQRVTWRGLASRWSWNHKTVKSFLDEIGVKIIYPEAPKLGGFIEFEEGTIKERYGNDTGTIRLIKTKEIVFKKERKGNDKGTIKERTIYPEPNPNKKNVYNPLKNKQEFLDNIPKTMIEKNPSFSDKDFEYFTDSLVDYVGSSGKPYKDYYAALRTFIRREKNYIPINNTKSIELTDEELNDTSD